MNKTLVAKPIVKDQMWVITDGKQKIGNVLSEQGRYELKIGENTQYFDSRKKIEKLLDVKFEKTKIEKTTVETPYAVWPTGKNRVYNNFYDVQRRIHVFTETANSKCYHAAGWFALKQGQAWEATFCPKYIFVQRYPYLGPFMNKAQVESAINTQDVTD